LEDFILLFVLQGNFGIVDILTVMQPITHLLPQRDEELPITEPVTQTAKSSDQSKPLLEPAVTSQSATATHSVKEDNHSKTESPEKVTFFTGNDDDSEIVIATDTEPQTGGREGGDSHTTDGQQGDTLQTVQQGLFNISLLEDEESDKK